MKNVVYITNPNTVRRGSNFPAMTETDDKYVLIWQLIIVRKSAAAAQIHSTKAQKFCLTFFVCCCEVYWFLMNHCQNRSWKTLLRELRTRRSCSWNFDAQSESLGPRWMKLCSERKRSSRSRAEQRYWLSCLGYVCYSPPRAQLTVRKTLAPL